jgi:hypothetical protein
MAAVIVAAAVVVGGMLGSGILERREVGSASPTPGITDASPSPAASMPGPIGGSLTPAPTATTEPEPPRPPSVAWERVGFEPRSAVSGLFFIEGRWFVAGSVSDEAAVWISDDGRG